MRQVDRALQRDRSPPGALMCSTSARSTASIASWITWCSSVSRSMTGPRPGSRAQVREDRLVLERVVRGDDAAVARAERAEGPVVLAHRHRVQRGARVAGAQRAGPDLATTRSRSSASSRRSMSWTSTRCWPAGAATLGVGRRRPAVRRCGRVDSSHGSARSSGADAAGRASASTPSAGACVAGSRRRRAPRRPARTTAGATSARAARSPRGSSAMTMKVSTRSSARQAGELGDGIAGLRQVQQPPDRRGLAARGDGGRVDRRVAGWPGRPAAGTAGSAASRRPCARSARASAACRRRSRARRRAAAPGRAAAPASV